MKFAVRFFLTFSLFFIFFWILKTPSFAQNKPNTTSVQAQNQKAEYLTPNTNSDVPNNLHTYTQNIMIEIMSALGCQLAGIDPLTKSTKCLGLDTKTGKLGYVESHGGAIGFMGGAIGMLYTPPINTGTYIRDVASNFGIAKHAYAQTGVGLDSIAAISGLWAVFRNIVYIFFVFIFVFIGVGIMLRVRIDPRTVMTIQNQIPKIIIGLILVTFSFAIAGFLIDLMWLLIIIIVNVLITAHPQLSAHIGPGTYVTPFGLSDVIGGFFGIANGTAAAIGGGIYHTFNANTVSSQITLPGAGPGAGCGFLDLGCWVGQAIASTIGAFVNSVVGIILGTIVGLFVWLVVIVAVIIALFRLWIALIGAYIAILMDIVFAPFWIIAGLFPGAGPRVGFVAWLRDMAGNLVAFPAVIGLFLIGRVLADGFVTSPGFFFPPLLGNADPASGGVASLGPVLAFGIIMLSPNIVKMTKAAFRAPDTGLGVTKGFSAGSAVVGAIGGGIWGRAYRRDPMTGKHYGPAVNLGRNVAGYAKNIPQSRPVRIVTQSPVGRATGAVTNVVVSNPVSRGIGKVARGTTGLFKPPTKKE